jgi:hypothetical protein
LFQPQDDIEAGASGVRNADQSLAHKQHLAFFADAAADRAGLAITPEYSMPRKTLEDAIRNGVKPGPGSNESLAARALPYRRFPSTF